MRTTFRVLWVLVRWMCWLACIPVVLVFALCGGFESGGARYDDDRVGMPGLTMHLYD